MSWRVFSRGALAGLLLVAIIEFFAFIPMWKVTPRTSPLIALPTPMHFGPPQERARKIAAQLEETCEDLHLFFGEPLDGAPPHIYQNDNRPMDSICYSGPSIELVSKYFHFEFRKEDDQLTYYLDSYLLDDQPAVKQYHDLPVKPQWTKVQAITIADAFRRVLQDPTGALLGEPSANYDDHAQFGKDDHGKMVKQYGLGEWTVVWPRVDSKGHPFYGDHVTIQIQEGCAPLGAGIFLTTPYAEETTSPISETVAVAKAHGLVSWRQLGQTIFFNVVGGDKQERDITGDKVLGKQLAVVIPRKGRWAYSQNSSHPPTARLAWIIWFEPIHSAPPSGPPWDDRLSVWIDAYTGEEIGGDAML